MKRKKSAVQEAPAKNAGSCDKNSDPRPNSKGPCDNKSKSGGSCDSKSKEPHDNKSKEPHGDPSDSGGFCESDHQSPRSQPRTIQIRISVLWKFLSLTQRLRSIQEGSHAARRAARENVRRGVPLLRSPKSTSISSL
jgi:hypothetical protein